MWEGLIKITLKWTGLKMKPKQCLETLEIWSPPFLHTSRRAFSAPSFSVSLEERGRAVHRAAFSWALSLPGALGTRLLSADFCICPLGSEGSKNKLSPFSRLPKRAYFPGMRATLTPIFLWKLPLLCFWMRTVMPLRILTHSPVILEYNRLSPHKKKPWWQMHSWAVMTL